MVTGVSSPTNWLTPRFKSSDTYSRRGAFPGNHLHW